MKKILALVLSLAMCAGMLLAFSLTSSAAGNTAYTAVIEDGSKGWVASFTVTYPTEGSGNVEPWSTIQADSKDIVGARIKYNPSTMTYTFEFQANAQYAGTKNQWSTRLPDICKSFTHEAGTENPNVAHVILYHEAGDDKGLYIEVVSANKVIYTATIDDSYDWIGEDADQTPIDIADAFQKKIAIVFGEAAGVSYSNGYAGTGAVIENHVKKAVGDNAWTFSYDMIFSHQKTTENRDDAYYMYKIQPEGGSSYVAGWQSTYNVQSKFCFKVQANIGGNWGSETRIGDNLVTPGNVVKIALSYDPAVPNTMKIVIKDINNAVIFEGNANNEVYGKDISGILNAAEIWFRCEKRANMPTMYYANINIEVDEPVVTTTAAATTAAPETTTAAATTAAPAPTPTPTTGDAMLAVVALAVVAMAGTAIVSKKRR